MARMVEGQLRAEGRRVALVVARTNAFITERLLDGAIDALRRTGCAEDDIEVVRVPGAFELPQVARWLVREGGRDAIVCLGAVLRGATPHFHYVASSAIRGIARVALEAAEHGTVVSMGVLTCESLEQAIERAGTKGGNKGFEATMSAIELCDLRRRVASVSPGAVRRSKSK